jgi:hypothetical protein
MPSIKKTREIATGCYAVVQFDCPPELQRWDRHLYDFLTQVGGIHFSNRHPATHFPDGVLRDGNKVVKTIDRHTCTFEFFLVSSAPVSLTMDALRTGKHPGVRVLYPN